MYHTSSATCFSPYWLQDYLLFTFIVSLSLFCCLFSNLRCVLSLLFTTSKAIHFSSKYYFTWSFMCSIFVIVQIKPVSNLGGNFFNSGVVLRFIPSFTNIWDISRYFIVLGFLLNHTIAKRHILCDFSPLKFAATFLMVLHGHFS